MRDTMKGLSVRVLPVLSVGLSVWMRVAAQQPSLTWLGTLGGSLSEARGVSADGSVVVGRVFNASGQVWWWVLALTLLPPPDKGTS